NIREWRRWAQSDNLARFVDAGFEEFDPFGHIDRVVAQAFQVFGHHKQVQRSFRLGRVGGDIVRNFGADPAEEGVGLVVTGDHLGGGGHIHLHIGADGLLYHAEHKVAHAVDISHHIKGFDNVLVKVQHNLRNVGSLVGN